MLLKSLYEAAKFSKPIIAYHGTSGEHLSSILKHGLKKSYSSGGYGSAKRSFSSSDTHDGVYVTTSLNIAEHIAKDIDPRNPLVVVVKVQRKGSFMDEDHVVQFLGLQDTQLKEMYLQDLPEGLENHENRVIDYTKKFTENVFSMSIKILRNSLDHHKVPSETINNIINEGRHIILDMVRIVVEHVASDIFPEIYQPNDNIFEQQKKLINLFKHALQGGMLNTFMVPHDIGFKGSNRIVGFYSPMTNTYWGDVDMGYPVKKPMDILP